MCRETGKSIVCREYTIVLDTCVTGVYMCMYMCLLCFNKLQDFINSYFILFLKLNICFFLY